MPSFPQKNASSCSSNWLPNLSTHPASIWFHGNATCKIDANASRAIECYPHCEMHELLLIKPVAVAMLILANAYFVAVEFALISIRDTRVEQLLAARVPGARAVRSLQANLDDLLPAVQLGVTLCSLALGWLGEPMAAQFLIRWIGDLPHAQIYGNAAALAFGFAI